MTTYNIEGGIAPPVCYDEEPPPESPGRDFSGVNVSDPEVWAEADEDIDWLVEDVFAADQPTIIGARKKSLKTTFTIDLAIALATGRRWLGKIAVPRKRKTLMIVGESSQRALVRRIKKACDQRGIPREQLAGMFHVEAADFPNLPDESDCISVQYAIKTHGFEVVIVDPLYMGLTGVNSSNLNEVGPALRRFKEACGDTSLVICHHVKKSAATEGPPDLDDLSQAGISEFAGNYWMMGRIGKYTGDGLHELAVAYGGRDEQFGMSKVAFDENSWAATFTSLRDHMEDQRQRAENERIASMKQRVLDVLRDQPDMSATESRLAADCGTKRDRPIFQTSLDELSKVGVLVKVPNLKAANNRPSLGWRLSSE